MRETATVKVTATVGRRREARRKDEVTVQFGDPRGTGGGAAAENVESQGPDSTNSSILLDNV